MWTSVITLFLAILQVSICAPVTKWQTITAITNADGSPYTWSPSAATSAATATVAAQAATTTAAAPATSTSTSTGFMGLLSSLASMLSDDSDSSSSASAASTSSSSSGSSWGSLFSLLLKSFGGSTSASSTSGSGASGNDNSATSTAATVANYVASSSKAATTKAATTKASNSDSTSTGGLYDAIYNSSEDIDEDFAKAILDSHNEYRALHGVGDLSWALGPYLYAKNNADNYDCLGVLTHTHGQYGENLAAGFSTGPSAVKAWYVEGETFDYNSYNEYNHFTQLVWKASTQVGCAYKDCSAEGWGKYIVCEYSPVGNVIGQEEENVLPLTS